jgi:hypothetical protein
MITLAPLTTAPVWSTTVPLMVPDVDSCALHSVLAMSRQREIMIPTICLHDMLAVLKLLTLLNFM